MALSSKNKPKVMLVSKKEMNLEIMKTLENIIVLLKYDKKKLTEIAKFRHIKICVSDSQTTILEKIVNAQALELKEKIRP